jgi:hypothetical protein
MKKSTVKAAIVLFLLSLGPQAFADNYDDCISACAKSNEACTGSARQFVNDIEVEDAMAVCIKSDQACNQSCTDEDVHRRIPLPVPGGDQPNP